MQSVEHELVPEERSRVHLISPTIAHLLFYREGMSIYVRSQDWHAVSLHIHHQMNFTVQMQDQLTQSVFSQ